MTNEGKRLLSFMNSHRSQGMAAQARYGGMCAESKGRMYTREELRTRSSEEINDEDEDND